MGGFHCLIAMILMVSLFFIRRADADPHACPVVCRGKQRTKK